MPCCSIVQFLYSLEISALQSETNIDVFFANQSKKKTQRKQRYFTERTLIIKNNVGVAELTVASIGIVIIYSV